MIIKTFYDKKFRELIIKVEEYENEDEIAWFCRLLAERLFYSEYKIISQTAEKILETIDGHFADSKL